MKVAVLRETFPGERRVALVPASVAALAKHDVQVSIETDAGAAAGFENADYEDAGACIVSRQDALAVDVLLQVRSLGANQTAGKADLESFRRGQVVIGMCDPLGEPQAIQQSADTGVTQFALELIPRTTRAQAMDVLSSMATIAGYRAVLLAALELPQMFPMVTYAAGMLRPARVFVIGAGVAGLRAIATAKQLGAVVQAHDIRPGSADEVRSVGAKFIELPLDGQTQDAGGYAKRLTDADYDRQRQLIAEVASQSDVVITTAAIPGRPAPLLVTTAAVENMPIGSVVVDLAAERGGNCEVSQADERVQHGGVTILGPTNTAAEVANHASVMFSNNTTRFLINLTRDGQVALSLEDDIICETLVTQDGQVVHGRIRELLGLPAAADAATVPGLTPDAEATPPETQPAAVDDNETIPFDSWNDDAAAVEEDDA